MPLSCLKQASRQRPESPSNPFPFVNSKSLLDPLRSPHVHFPPSPRLVSVQLTHSPTTYDRRAIVVDTNNACALPARFDRYYDISSPEIASNPASGLLLGRADEPAGYFEVDDTTPYNNTPYHLHLPPPPPLTPDFSESSDDSLPNSPPEVLYIPGYTTKTPFHRMPGLYHPHHPPIPSPEDLGAALSFLPHPWSNELQLGGIPTPPQVSPPPRASPPRRKPAPGPRRARSASNRRQVLASSSFDESELDGCLGGF